MSPLANDDWKLLRHLHLQIATEQAKRIQQGARIRPQAYLISPGEHGQAQLAELSHTFLDNLLEQEDGQRLLAKYLADALQPGSAVQQHIAHDYGFTARYTISCQEAMLPQADGSQQPVLMVLLHGQGFALPVFHTITTTGTQRQCHLRSFPDLAEFQAVQSLLEQRLQQGSTTH